MRLRPGFHAQFWSLLLAGVIGAVLLRHFLFGDKVMLFTDIGGDTYYAYYPYYYLLTDLVAAHRLPGWSFQVGMGTSVFSLFSILYDPFMLVYFAAGTRRLAQALAWVFLLKVVCSAWFGYLYARCLGLQPQIRVLVALLCAFNGFMMVWGQHFPMATWVMCLPLVLYALERYLREGRWLLLCLLCAWMVLSISIFYQFVIFCGLYVLARCLWWRCGGQALPWPRLIRLAGVVVLGVGLSAVLWWPEYYLLRSSPRISESFIVQLRMLLTQVLQLQDPAYYRSLLHRLFSSNLEGVAQHYAGHLNYYESIQLYGGLLPWLLIPQALVVQPRKARWLVVAGTVLVVAAVALPAFGMLMNGLQYPSYRWGFGIIVFEVAVAAWTLQAMLEQRRVHVPLLLGTLLLLSAVLVALWNAGAMPFAGYARVLALLAGYGMLLVWWVRAQRRQLPFAILLLVLVFELVAENAPTFDQRTLLPKGFEKSGDGFFDGAFQAARALRQQDESFYRVEKDHWAFSPNDALVQGYRGLDSYVSLNTPSYVDLMFAFGITDEQRYARWNSLQHPYLADIAGVKYHLTKSLAAGARDMDKLGRYGDVDVYARRGALPFGFVYDTYVPATLWDSLSLPDRERVMLHGARVEGSAQGTLRALATLPPVEQDAAARTALRAQTVQWRVLEDDRMSGRIASARGGLLFLSIPQAAGWTATLDGKPVDILRVNVGFSGVALPPGESVVELAYAPPLRSQGSIVSLASLGVLGLCGLLARRRPRPAPAARASDLLRDDQA